MFVMLLPMIASAMAATAADTDSKRLGDLSLSHFVARSAAAPNGDVAGYFKVTNDGAMDRLVGAFCTCAARIEIHQIVRDDSEHGKGDLSVATLTGMPVNSFSALVIPGHSSVELRPGSDLHLMLIGMKAPLVNGQRIDVTLLFEHAGTVTVPFVAVEDTRAEWIRLEQASAAGK
jgi:periplasmic copper chaperone A